MKVAYNARYGGFGLSEAAILLGREMSGNDQWGGACLPTDCYDDGDPLGGTFFSGGGDLDRADPVLIAVVEALGNKASSAYAHVVIADIASGTLWRITEYDGFESIATPDDYDWRVAT